MEINHETMSINSFFELIRQSNVSGSRSTILKSLSWLIAILFASLITMSRFNLPEWIVTSIAIMLFIAIAIFFFTFIYCLFKNPDALRSEKYSIQKMAIEKGVYGDDTKGAQEGVLESTSKHILHSQNSNKSK